LIKSWKRVEIQKETLKEVEEMEKLKEKPD
jgi:hypothetical protein